MEQDPKSSEFLVQGTRARFEDTGWTTVIAGRNGAPEALARLCRIYWYPLYASLRLSGNSPENAKDLTQGFFAHLLRSEALKSVDRSKGRFRTFLLVSLKNFAHAEWEKMTAQQRGGRHDFVSIDTVHAEESFASELVTAGSSESFYDQRWATALVSEVTVRLRQRYANRGKLHVFDVLEPFLTGEVPDGTPARLAQALSMNENTVKSELHRLRRHEFAVLLEQEVRETLYRPTEQDVRDEIRHLFASLAA